MPLSHPAQRHHRSLALPHCPLAICQSNRIADNLRYEKEAAAVKYVSVSALGT
jgi:hypothetical protein